MVRSYNFSTFQIFTLIYSLSFVNIYLSLFAGAAYSFERPLVDGTPEFEIRAATPENAPFRVLASIPASRVPIWQIVNPALSPDGKWLAQALTDGFTTNIWALQEAFGQLHKEFHCRGLTNRATKQRLRDYIAKLLFAGRSNARQRAIRAGRPSMDS
jgi:hypothetical protein